MKTIALVAAAMLAAGAAHADGALGNWKTQPDDNGNYGIIAMSNCGGKLCGTLTRSFDASGNALQSPNNGRMIVSNMAANGGGQYSGGTIYAPDRDRTYRSKMTLSGDTLTVAGCIGPICRNQNWTRSN